MQQRVPIGAEPEATLRWLIGQGRTPFQRIATVLANKHKLALIWELARGPKRFKELERALAPVTAKVLTRNLRDLEAMALVVRRDFDVSPPKVEYRLSAVGSELVPHIRALCRWTLEHAETLMPREA